MRFMSVCCAVLGLLVAGCDKAGDGSDGSVGALSLFDPIGANPSLCGSPAIPYPNNALFADGTSPTGLTRDTTLNIPSTASTAVAANLTDGFSTTASIFTDMLGALDPASIAGSLVILEADATPRVLQPGIDFTFQPSIAMSQVLGTGGACSANPLPAKFQPISQQRTRILIEPLKPLAPSTTYIVAVRRSLLSLDGVPAVPNEFFPIVNSDRRICRLATDGAGPEPLCSDGSQQATLNALAATVAPVLGTLPTSTAPVQLTTLESLRRNLVRPTVTAMRTLLAAISGPTVTDDDLVIAWSFTTQSIGATLATLNAIATPKTFTVGAAPNGGAGDLDGNGRLGTGELGLPLANSADIWVGTFNSVPYYLDDASSTTDAASQAGFWLNDGTITSTANGGFVPFTPPGDYDGNPATPPTPAPCSGPPFNFQATPPTSTTNCFRIPLERSQETLPVMITVPKTAKPASGWPVAIFQHGITGHRGQMIPIGAALGAAGFVTVAIDLPLHGILAGDPAFGPFRQAGLERTFDLDIVGNASGAPPGGDGTDPSGTHFINLASLITSRDNLRQAVADLIHLTRSLGDPGLSFDGVAGNDIDTSRIHFAGISLGGIVGTTLLGVNSEIKAASLSVPGGGVAKLLDASASFGPRIAAGLAGVAFATDLNGASSPFEGTDTYETFLRFAQHLVDPGDPINFAVAANAGHRIHMVEVIGDAVVPNTAYSNCVEPAALPPGIGATATSNATNAETRLAACRAGAALVGTNAATTACAGSVVACASTPSQDETLISGFLSGTEPLYGLMGLEVVGPISPPGTAANRTNASGLDVVVRFAANTAQHGSLLTPDRDGTSGNGNDTDLLPATCEMQRQTVSFLASNGTLLQIGGTCP
jgi:dienelactone hydrolase